MRTPWQLRVPAAVAAAFLVLPLVALLFRVPWLHLPDLFREPIVGEALRLSLLCATIAALLAAVTGIPLAWLLARSTGRLTGLVRALVTVPLVLPPVVGGVALLSAFGRRGLLGKPIDVVFGFSLPFTPFGVIVAETFVALPFLVLTVEGAFRTLDDGYAEAAATLGASPWFAFRRVVLPMMAPALLAGTVLAWARALGEFGATITFAGNSPGRTQTMPLAVYLAMERDPDAASALSLVMLVVCVVVLALLRGRWLTTGSAA
ncbi:Molybdenum transport system permease protein modB [Nostocoides australiense Ben110]|uniref:Molybdenum transport system permease n=1 Tax=Nostocoides australiense Ben110 TaxID=1193182 RepID=W6JY90_9MICO|nr:ABC transporter permease [Tetrasphaera australiensis]MCA0291494.1 ABC transporter permease [Actinomycetota bacterium]MCB1300550.1 molybdate ABC transporter permease subunit [Tetrasphaera sp.]CCH74493.1 Molybdenum transport system permease protein modB [Tetrasphaera australiensis Ben110]